MSETETESGTPAATSGYENTPRGRARFLYVWFGVTPPVEYADWVRRDIQSGSWIWRRAIQTGVAIEIGAFIAGLLTGHLLSGMLGIGIGIAILILLDTTLLRSWQRRRVIAYYEKRWQRRASRHLPR